MLWAFDIFRLMRSSATYGKAGVCLQTAPGPEAKSTCRCGTEQHGIALMHSSLGRSRSCLALDGAKTPCNHRRSCSRRLATGGKTP